MNIKELKDLLNKALSEGVDPKTPITILTGDMNDNNDIFELAQINLIHGHYYRDNSPKLAVSINSGTSLVLLSQDAVLHEKIMLLHEYFD